VTGSELHEGAATRLALLADGLQVPESPRWHNDQLVFVDIFAGEVLRYQTQKVIVAKYDDQVSSVGAMPDDALLVVLKFTQRVLRLAPDGTTELYADLSDLGGTHLNDMITDSSGRAYVDLNSYLPGRQTPLTVTDRIALIDTDRSVRVVATELLGPNGLALSPDGKRLVVAETRGRRVTEFDVNPSDASLGSRRHLFDTGERSPDGLCLDEQGAIWFASTHTHEVARWHPSLGLTDSLSLPATHMGLACTLGGPDRRTLFVCSADIDTVQRVSRGGALWSTVVPIAGAGRP
jgi:sugar lactone lactonase YvrE